MGGLARILAALAVALALPGGAPASERATVGVSFLQGEQVVVVQRSGSGARAAVTALLAGPTAAERAREITTQVPAGVPLRSVTLANGTATVDLGERFASGTRAESLSARVAQLVLTVTAVPGVRRVKLLVKGGTPLGLFPGYVTAFPLTRGDVQAPDAPAPVTPVTPGGPPAEDVRALQQRLADLGYLAPEGVDGRAGEQTTFAILGFQKWEGLGRDGVAGPQTRAVLERAVRPTPRTSGGGKRVEVLLDRQLALVVDGGTVVRTLHVSSGKPGYETPAGSFTVSRKERNSWSVPYKVWLPYASYFVGGVAFHEYPDVPASAASHGCVRVPRYDVAWLYGQTPIGTRVIVLRTSR
jgi:L,D-transpeptidase catalytic domain/Sporulation and spore germination/Putative peptidoglycan binding domain